MTDKLKAAPWPVMAGMLLLICAPAGCGGSGSGPGDTDTEADISGDGAEAADFVTDLGGDESDGMDVTDGTDGAEEAPPCMDEDEDGFGTGCLAGDDCDDTSPECTTDCSDLDEDLVYDCKDDCIDVDGDEYGAGEGCLGEDCDDGSALCTTDCETDENDNGHRDCDENCDDDDGDGYGEGDDCLGPDCDDTSIHCNTDCDTDANGNGHRDCDEDCVDPDGDGYGEGDDCLGDDCDEGSVLCNEDCSDANGNTHRDCDENCDDGDGDGYGEGDDCLGPDCDDTSFDCNTDCDTDGNGNGFRDCDEDCMDNDRDGYGEGDDCMGDDCDDESPECTVDCETDDNGNDHRDCDEDCVDDDRDGYGEGDDCLGDDCDDTSELCTEECEDIDGDTIFDCKDDCVDPDGDRTCGEECCDDDQICLDEGCTDIEGGCVDDEDCMNDHCCYESSCVPYETSACGTENGDCLRLVVAGLCQPTLQCEWTAPPDGDPFPLHYQILGTPVVADMNLDANPDTVRPLIIFNSYDGLDGDSGILTDQDGVVRIIDGRDCTQLYNIGPYTNGCNPPAVADLDLDGVLEVIIHWNDGATEIHAYDGGTDSFVQRNYSHVSGGARFAPEPTGWGGPSIYDLDDDGVPEILSGGVVYDNNGLVLDSSLGLRALYGIITGFPAAADLDGDGLVELATGTAVYEFDPATSAWVLQNAGGGTAGYTAVADFGTYTTETTNRQVLDGLGEIAVVRSGWVRIEANDGRVVFGPLPLPASSGGGPPTIGDFDGDGRAEFAAAGSDSYTVFDPDCTGAPDPDFCASTRTDGILWTQPSQDHSSNITGSSIFDFEGDGKAEAVYADECFVRIYDGTTGEVLYSQWHSSCTWNENPIVADVDNDYNAELIVPSNQNCGTSPSNMGGTPYYSYGGYTIDPLFAGLSCETEADCPGGPCDSGYCRCSGDPDCGSGGFVCAPPPSGTPGSGNTCRAAWLGSVNGIRVYRDMLDRWVDTRTIWNQHAYSITHIEENGLVPRTSLWQQNWLVDGYNNFRQNTQGDLNPEDMNDFTSGSGALVTCDSEGNLIIQVNICNRGLAPAPPGINVAFYNGDPELCDVLCVSTTTTALAPGTCEAVTCVWPDAPPSEVLEIHVVADDDGTCGPDSGSEGECVEGNNEGVFKVLYCTIMPD